MTTQANPDILLPQLCTQIGVSQRSLEHAFQHKLGMTAISYLRLRRLNMARRELMFSQKSAMTVSEIAFRHGFYELGRFAVEYRRLFGEKPSETLAGHYPEAIMPLVG